MTDTMTNTHLAAADPADRREPPTRLRPRGIPSWLWLFGVSIEPVGPPGADGIRTWVVSAGIGPASLAAVFFDHDDHH